MKKGLLLIIISLIAYSQLLSQNDYYYSANKKIIMANTENKYVIGISDSSDFITLSKVAKNITPLECNSMVTQLDVSRLKSGIYMVVFRHGNGKVVRKFVKM